MADSDSDYIASSGDEAGLHRTRKGDRKSGKTSKAKVRDNKLERWEEVKRAWDDGLEDEDIETTVAGIIDAEKRKRLHTDETPLQRGILRHLTLILDLSSAMAEKDLRPTRYLLTLRHAAAFINEFFTQNPISQLSLLGMRDGLAIRLTPHSGNPFVHIEALTKLRLDEPSGMPSLQNALEMARAELYHTPQHGTREIVLIYGALWSADPGDIHQTISNLAKDRIRVTVVGLSAQVAVCRELVAKTNAGSIDSYRVALNEQHYRDILLAATAPPVTRSAKLATNGLLMMGFPSRTVAPTTAGAGLCACHGRPTKGGYLCSRCDTKVCSLPVECPSCGLTLILSTHLARSYHHLFPLKNFAEVSWDEAEKAVTEKKVGCFGCLTPFPRVPEKGSEERARERGRKTVHGISTSGRYRCKECGSHFCIDCDVFAHETLHNCPGCQALGKDAGGVGEADEENKGKEAVNGAPKKRIPEGTDTGFDAGDPMILD
ncbi:TFIIH basal transcription factor complex, subunit SSL1 [Ascodesmis nigricans]|uniref:General transcription and DNA repair factor IIH n=1 Tax=Ascodesmis nigricans TaxID=341454 RepID=A0A4S2N7T3_9PEZI|nr:TFIIH basal transcription factor complex, subunit SSL1 [Ascodesmis nigricans]